MKRVKKQKSKERETHSCCIHYSVKKRKLRSAINGKKKEEKTKRKTEEEAATEDESVISDGVGNLFAAASTMRRSYFVVFFFFVFFFFRNLSSFLVLFFSLQIPLLKIWNYYISLQSLFFFMFFHFLFISSRSDHNFIPVYWPKFTGKAETKRNHPNLKNQLQFSKPYSPTTVRTGACHFPI